MYTVFSFYECEASGNRLFSRLETDEIDIRGGSQTAVRSTVPDSGIFPGSEIAGKESSHFPPGDVRK